MKRVLITGGSGLLGKALLGCVPAEFEALGTRYMNNSAVAPYTMNIGSVGDIHRAVYTYRPEIIIHTAAIGAVDYCERNPDESKRINCDAVANLAAVCKTEKIKLVLMSTNAVFDGTNPPYAEDAVPHPISAYGMHKVCAERYALELVPDALVVRTARMFGLHNAGGRENWIDYIRKAVAEKRQMKIVTDDVANPTYADHLARNIWEMTRRDLKGIYHAAGAKAVSMYQFAIDIADTLYRKTNFIIPITHDDLPAGIMTRPADTTFDMGKLRSEGLCVESYRVGLACVQKRLADGD